MEQQGRGRARRRQTEAGDSWAPGLEALREDVLDGVRRVEQRLDEADRSREPSIQHHVRRFLPFYAVAAAWALFVALVPSQAPQVAPGIGVSAGRAAQEQGSPSLGAPTGTADGAALPDQAPGALPKPGATSETQADIAKTPSLIPAVTGLTRGGFECEPGVRQLPWSDYAGPCIPRYDGDNGGATSRGVTKDQIVISRRVFGEPGQFAAATQAAGFASADVYREVRETFVDYFNETFELYGRKVVFVEYTANPQASDTEEAQSRGKEGACIDATKAAEEIKAFADKDTGYGPYGECLAERKVVHIAAGPHFSETWYRKHHPYLYNVLMECERLGTGWAEYIGKRLAGRDARWSGDVAMQQKARAFGVYHPNNDEYERCVNVSEQELEKYGVNYTSRYRYALDVSRFPDEAARGVVQFKAAGVTTMVNGCEPYSMIFLTQAASAQNYFPEWFILGLVGQDLDSFARLYDQKQADGHLFGMSHLGDQTKLWGPDSEPGQTYKRITGKDIPDGTEGNYFELIRLFTFLQAAGPNLTPHTMEQGVHALPAAGTRTRAAGYWSYADGPDGTPGAGDHTAVDDSREVYWCGTCTSALDGERGHYLETYGGKRFRNGEWPAEEPPIYPNT